MTRKQLSDVDPWAVFGEMWSDSDRACVIVGAEMLSLALEQLLRRRLVESPALHKRMFVGPSAPLSSFSSKIDLAYALGLLEEFEYRNFHRIREMRNDAAHTPEHLRFDTEPFAQRVDALSNPYDAVVHDVRREKFIHLVQRHITDAATRVPERATVPATDDTVLPQLRADHEEFVRRLVEDDGFDIHNGILVAPPGYQERTRQVAYGEKVLSDGRHRIELYRSGKLAHAEEADTPAAARQSLAEWERANPYV